MRNERHREIDSAGNLWAWSAKAVNNLPHLHTLIARADAAWETRDRQGSLLRQTAQRTGPRWLLRQSSEWNDASNHDPPQPGSLRFQLEVKLAGTLVRESKGCG